MSEQIFPVWTEISVVRALLVVMYYTSAHSSLKSDLKFRTSLLPSVGSIFLNQKMENYIFFILWKHTMAPFLQ